MSLYAWLKPKGPNGFGYGSTAEEVTEGISLAGKTMLVTGCNSGIGAETVRVLALRGAHVIGTARTAEKAQAACALVTGKTTGVECELSDPASVRHSVETITKMGVKLDAIVTNAGIMALPKLEKAHGYELQFFTNHVGHFMLVTGLLDVLADDGRVVCVSSSAHNNAPDGGIEFDNLDGARGYSAWRNYGQSKIANVLFAKELSRRFEGTKRTANALHPGVIQTNLGRSMNRVGAAVFFTLGSVALKSIPQGAATQTFLAAHPSVAGTSGEFFADCNVAKSRRDSRDPALAARLWAKSEEIVAGLG